MAVFDNHSMNSAANLNVPTSRTLATLLVAMTRVGKPRYHEFGLNNFDESYFGRLKRVFMENS